MLRLDRIDNITPLASQELKQRDIHPVDTCSIRILNCLPEHYEPLGQEDTITVDPENPEHLIVTLNTDNTFLLRQKLLSTHYDFQFLSPTPFSQRLQDTLEGMRRLYQ
jgi:hypothetical protein